MVKSGQGAHSHYKNILDIDHSHLFLDKRIFKINAIIIIVLA